MTERINVMEYIGFKFTRIVSRFSNSLPNIRRNKYNPLQKAIRNRNYEAFNSLLSHKKCPLETDKDAIAALGTALNGTKRYFVSCQDEYFACELIKRGVNIKVVFDNGNSPLHCAFKWSMLRVARLLIDKEADINARNEFGYTPLHEFLRYHNDDEIGEETLGMALYYGADATMPDFHGTTPFCLAVRKELSMATLEILFLYSFDEYTKCKLPIDVLITLGKNDCPFFEELVEKTEDVYIDYYYYDEWMPYRYNVELFAVNPQYLKILIERFDYAIKELVWEYSIHPWTCFLMNIDSLEILLNSNFKPHMLNVIIDDLTYRSIIKQLFNIGVKESEITGLICYLLSHGMPFDEKMFQFIYSLFGFNELLEIVLHMDFNFIEHLREYYDPQIVPSLLYDMNLSIETYLSAIDVNDYCQRSCLRMGGYYRELCDFDDPTNPTILFDFHGLKDLLSYSTHPKLKELCSKMSYKNVIKKLRELPQVPLLLELARDVFRDYFIKKFSIKSARQFYTTLKTLPISQSHQEIIMFKKKLY